MVFYHIYDHFLTSSTSGLSSALTMTAVQMGLASLGLGSFQHVYMGPIWVLVRQVGDLLGCLGGKPYCLVQLGAR